VPTLLVEIGCDELPASACREAERQLRDRFLPRFGGKGHVFVGPRRLALIAEEVPERTEDEWVKGPPENLREKAAAGFARRHGVAPEDLELRDGFLGVTVAGKALRDTLPAEIDALVRSLSFGKSMMWVAGGLRFARAVRWLCVKLDADTVDMDVDGIPSGGISYGHRFTHAEVEIPAAEAYLDALRAADVEPDQRARRATIEDGLAALGLAEPNPRVLGEVVYLVESPIVLEGTFDERFLGLPERVVTTAMESHQRYFPLGGNRFAFVANGGDPETVVRGNERVLSGRLEDASFTFERDVARGIEGLAGDLGSITFVAGAGSFADKTERLVALVEALGGGEASREAARLAKADQAAELVREFPDLEGHIGAEYARLAGFPEAVCAAIEEQYLPDVADGPLPQTEGGRVLAAAEKVDNLTVAFALGERPTGSRDPYGLRRAAIGLCRLAVQVGLEIPVPALVERNRAALAAQGAEVKEDPTDVWDFVLERLEGLLDVPVEFVRAARASSGVRELGAVAQLAQALAAAAETDTFERAYVAFDRSNRLGGRAQGAAATFDPRLVTDEAEEGLFRALGEAAPRIEGGVVAGEFEDALAAAGELGPAVDRFFDEVLVMAEDEAVRANRLRLLLDVRDAVGLLGDLSQIPR
jgi:glycyl-tRNA synthetase beta chain